MSFRSGILSLVASALILVPFVAAAGVQVPFWADQRLQLVQREVPDGAVPVEAALAALAAGPTDDERAVGIASALPAGTTINQIVIEGDNVTIDFSPNVLFAGVDEIWIEAVFQQVRWTLDPFDIGRSIRLTVAGAPLSDYLPLLAPEELPAPGKTGLEAPITTAAGSALAGRSIAISPGHGMRWNGSSWNFERPVYCAPLNNEDLHNVELMAYLVAYLAQDGATTKVYRCLDQSYGNYAAGKPWWTMSASYWLKHIGYPCSVYAGSTGDCTLGTGSSQTSDSLISRPRASNYDNTNIYISMHTNGLAGDCTGGGCPNGTCTYYDSGTVHAQWGAISQSLAQKVNTGIVQAIRNHYGDTTWRDRGALNSNGGFAETRLPTRAAILIELAFHDSCDRDGLYLQDEWFRSATTWGVYKGVCDYFGTSPTYDFYSSEYVSDTIPAEMMPGQSYDVSVTFRNRGVLWTAARQFRLGAVGDSDPFTSFGRVTPAAPVGTSQECTFEFTMTAPMAAGSYTTDWRMVRESVTWFGATLAKQVVVGRTSPRGDFDLDGDVDLEDFGHLQRCYTGVGVPQNDPTCQDAKLDGDQDVDPTDFTIFEACLTGPGIDAEIYCGD